MIKITSAVEIIRKFGESDPVRAASALEALPPSDAATLMLALPVTVASPCFENLTPRGAAALCEHMPVNDFCGFLSRMNTASASAVLRFLPNDKKRCVVSCLPHEFAEELRLILTYPHDSAGALMRPDFTYFRQGMRVSEVIARLRSLARRNMPTTYCYVVGHDRHLMGVLNMRDLIIANPAATVESIMRREIFTVSPFEDRQRLIQVFSEKKYLAIPVVDSCGAILGVVNTEKLISSTEAEATEDIQILFGANPDEHPFSPMWFKIRKRLPWLNINLLTAFMASAVVALFEGLIAKVAALAVFLTVIAGQGGNAGIQSLSITIRGLVMREIQLKDSWRMIVTEGTVGLANGIIIGIVSMLGAWLWKGNIYLGMVVGIAMVLNMLAACLSGAFVPILMKRLGFDPAQSSGIFVTTITDIVGFFSFLGCAYLFQDKLM